MILDIVLLIIGLAAIVKSADILINSSTNLAKRLKIPVFVVGIVIVAFGTSAPELVIGIMSGISKTNELTLGNIIGSGFSNIALILGICAVILPLKTDASVVKKEIPILIGTELLLFGLLFFDKILSLIDGVIMIAVFIIFMVYIIIKTKLEQNDSVEVKTINDGQQHISLNDNLENGDNLILQNSDVADNEITQNSGIIVAEVPEKQDSWRKIIILLIVSLAGLFVGGKLTVDSSSSIALSLGLSETFIGITVIAIATTLPELVASVIAVRKKEADIVLGNCIGSNIFNILLVAGSSAMLNPIEFDPSLVIDLCILIALTFLVFLVGLLRKKLSRPMGIILLSSYALIIAFKILSITVLSGII